MAELEIENAEVLLRQFKADVLRLATSDPYGNAVGVVIAGLLDVAEGLMRRAVRTDPVPASALLSRIDAMRANVARIAQPAEPFGPMN